jgi:hypothetical protein
MIVANHKIRNNTCLVRIPTNFLKKFPRSIWDRGEASALGFLVWAANIAAWCWAITSSLSLSSLASLQNVIKSFSDLRNQIKVNNTYCSGLLDMSMGLTAKPPPEPEVTVGSSPPCESDLAIKKRLMALHREAVLNDGVFSI